MKKQMVSIFAVLALALSGCGSSDDTADLQSQIDELKAENEALKEQLAGKGETPKPTTKPKATAESTEYDYTYKVLRWNAYTDSINENEFQILIEIHNTSAGPIQLYSFDSELDIEDTNGHLVDTGQAIYGCYPYVISAGETGYVYGGSFIRDDGTVNPEDMRPVLSLSLYEASADPIELETSDTSISNSSGMYARIAGRVENTTDETTAPVVGAYLYDADGKLLAVGSSQADTTEPGEKTSVSVSVDIEGTDLNYSDIADYKLVATSVSGVNAYTEGRKLTGKEIQDDNDVSNTAAANQSEEKVAGDISSATAEAAVADKNNESSSSGVGNDVKEFVDCYEDFMNAYCDFMETYDSSDVSALTEYTKLLGEYAEWTQKAEDFDDDDLNNDELAYWMDAQNRINKRLLEVTN